MPAARSTAPSHSAARCGTPPGDGAPRPPRVAPVAIGELAAAIGVDAGKDWSQVVSGVTLRASDVRPGDLFAALPGTRHHGADFAGAALAAGAVAVLTDPAGARRVDAAPRDDTVPVLVHRAPRDVLGVLAARVYGDPTAALSVIGVTGTSGKTTVAHLVEAGLDAAGRISGLLGTIGTRIAGTPLPSALTTPEAPDLQATLAVMAQAGVTDVAMEVSSHALAMGRVGGTRFAVGAFTNLSQDHLDFHRDMESYFATKARLFGPGGAAAAVVCVDDEWGVRLAAGLPGAMTVSTSYGSGGHWHATDVRTAADGTQRFTAHGPGGPVPVTLRLPGAFNVANALVALACLELVGVPAAVAAPAWARVAVPGRMQRIEAGQPYLAVVDYAHKPAAVAALLDALRAQVPGRLLVVLGCGGDRDAGKRPLMGAAAAARAELLVVTDDNPRSEDPATIRAAMLAGARPAAVGEVLETGDRRSAIMAAVARARPGDAVVVAGKGHESGQEIAGVRHGFDDAQELTAAIAASERTT